MDKLLDAAAPSRRASREAVSWYSLRTIVQLFPRVVRSVLNEGLTTTLRTLLRASPILLHLGGHARLTRLLTRPQMIGLLQRHPRLNYRYLGTYLSHDFDRRTRLKILLNHYGFLAGRVQTDFFVRIFDEKPLLWRERRGEDQFSIGLTFPAVGDHEGDLCLFFAVNAVPVYRLAFSIVPGPIVRIASDQVLFVGCVQGGTGCFDLIRHATRSCQDITPASLLLAAAQGIARSLGIEWMVGVGREQSVSRSHCREADSFFNFDAFWKSCGAEETRNNLFVLPLPFPEKPIQLIAADHRRRTLRKRAYKRQVAQQVLACFKEERLQAQSGAG